MKRVTLLLAAAFCITLAGSKASAQVPISYYDFESNSNRTVFENQTDLVVNGGNSSLSRSGGTGTVVGVNGAGSILYGGPANGRAIQGVSWPASNVDPGIGASNYIQFTGNTVGFSDISLMFDVLTGPDAATYPFVGVLVSTNGGSSFTQLGSYDAGLNTWGRIIVNLPAGANNNNSSLLIRIYGYFSGTTGTLTLDNINLMSSTATSGTKSLLPETNIYTSTTSGASSGANGPVIPRTNFVVNGGTVTTNGPEIFNGALAVQSGSLTLSGLVDAHGSVSVSGGATLACGNFTNPTIIGGTGSFTLNSGATFMINDANGITSGTTALGNVQVTGTRTYNPGAFYHYIRSASGTQLTGNGLPANLTGNLVVNLGAGATAPLTLSQSTTISGALIITNKTFDLGVSTLTLNASAAASISGSGTITVGNGAILRNATSITGGGPLIFNSAGRYQHNQTAGTIPTATWQFGSTCEITGYTSGSTLGGLGQSFANFIWNSPSQTGNVNAAGNFVSVNETLRIQNTGSGSFRLAGGTSPTLNVSGSLIVDGGTFIFSTDTGVPTVNITVNVTLNGGTLQPAAGSGVPVFNVGGNWTNNGGTFTPGTGAVTFNNGSAAQVINGTASTQTFNGLTVSKSNNQTLSVGGSTTALTLTGGLNVSAGTFSAPLTLNIAGDLSNSGTFSHNSGLVNFNKGGGGTQLVGGTSATVFNNVTTGNGVDFGTGAPTAAVNGNFTINTGGFVANNHPPIYNSNSTLRYNTGGAYGAGGEWTAGATSGAGVPQNVQVSTSGTSLNFGSSASPRTALGNVSIDAGTTLTLSTSLGGDLKVGGNWTRAGTFNPNGRAVTFNGAGTQTVARGVAGSEVFDYLVIDKASGNLTLSSSPATGVLINGSAGDVLQILNSGGVDLNGQSLVLQNNGGNVLAGGGVRTVTGATGSNFTFTGSKGVTSTGGGTLVFDTNVNVSLQNSVDFGASLSTVNGTLSVNNGGSVNTNPPTYGTGSTLVYDCFCVFSRSTEWSATAGPGYPYNVRLNNTSGTDLDLGGSSPGTLKQLAGNLNINSGVLYMDFSPNQMTAALKVLGDVTIASGSFLRLSDQTGGDLRVQGNFNSNGTFTHNNRAVYFEGGNTQTVNASSGSLTMPYVRVNKSGGTVQLGNTDLSVLGSAGGNSIDFTGSTSTLTLNTRTLTLGSTVGTAPAGSGLVGDAAASLSLQDGGATGAMGTIVFASGGQTLGNLTINRTGTSGSAALGSNLTLQSALALTAGNINAGSFVLTHNGTSTGAGDVVGGVRRTDLGVTARSFGNPNNQLSFTSGTAPTEITVNLVKSVPTGNGFGYPGAVQRTYTITPTGGSGYTATLRLHYLDAELNGNTEALLDFWRFNGSSWNRVLKTPAVGQDLTNNWIESNLVTQFSPWTLAQGNALTDSRLSEFKATQYDAVTLLSWQTGYEVDNLGFNVYREVGGRRALVNPSLIAGSALVAGPNVALTAGNSYTWTDSAVVGARYYLEEIDLAGQSKLYGPYTPARVGGRGAKGVRSSVLSELTGDASPPDAQRQLSRADAPGGLSTRPPSGGSATAQERQRWLASQPSVKIAVRAAGWYRVTREQLTAAGLSAAADPARLQLYVGGVEVPIRVGADGSMEFYGQGLDVQSTDTRVYWLVEGDTAGLRTNSAPAASGGDGTAEPGVIVERDRRRMPGTPIINIVPVDPSPDGPGFFNYTVERRDRTVYFSGLQNGEAENFFGKVVNATPGSQTLTVRNLLQLDAQTATLEVALQGLTAGEHHVAVSFNGARLGTLDFAGQTNKSASFTVEGYMLREGDNQVQLAATGPGDVTLTDHLRLTYLHSMKADDNRLRFSAPAGPIRLGGFSSPNVRVVDVTDPDAPFEVPIAGDALPDPQGGFSVHFNVTGTDGERELFAFVDTQMSQPASVLANSPSALSTDAGQQADMVVVTHGSFAQQVAPLVAQREAEGLNVKVVDVEDLFDEFSYGAHTPQAVRDFLAWTKANWEKAPAYVLLVGDGSYDPRDYLARGRYDLVPSKLLDAGAMETASDDWFADFDDDGIADLAVGRLPVRTPAEASTVVGKIVSRTFDPSQTSALLVADRDGADGYNFESATDGVQALLPAGASVARVNRRAQDATTVRSQIVSGVNAGPLVVNWMGHGSIDVWTGDGLLRGADAPVLQNGSRLPLFVMMTCLNGYYEGTGLDSLAESVLKAEQGGAYAVWASSGMTEPNAQAEANRELYRIIFAEGGAVRLGDAVRRAKAATADRDVRRTWVFFGDPSSRLR